MKTTWAACIVHHDAVNDLVACLESLRAQTDRPVVTVVWDTGVDPEGLAGAEARYPEAIFLGGENAGYAGGANRAIEAVIARDGAGQGGPDHVLVLNPDVVLDADFAKTLREAVDCLPEVAVAGGKLLRPGRAFLDSAGIVYPRHRRPRDRGSEVPDRGQFDRRERVDGVSGAAMWLRVSTLGELAVEGELFDEAFFAYHEDTDLCWRARRMGFEVLYVPEATAVHARGWRRDRRKSIAISVRRHSFKNHYLQLIKNETAGDLVRNAPWLIGWEVLRAGFVVLRDPALLPAYREALRLAGVAWRKRRWIQARADSRRDVATRRSSDC